MTKCPSCGKKVSKRNNFCKYCGKKIKDVCSNCWVRKKDNYSCGESNCPGYNLFSLEKMKLQTSNNHYIVPIADLSDRGTEPDEIDKAIEKFISQ